MKNIYINLIMVVLLFAALKSQAQTISPVIYPQFSTDSSTGARLPYVFRAKISGLTANALYRCYARAASLAIDGNNGSGGNAIFIRKTGNFTYATNPGFGGVGAMFDTMRADASGEVSHWFAFEPIRGNTSRFNDGSYIHARVFIQPATGGAPTTLTITDSILIIRIESKSTNATGVYSTSLAPAKDMVFLYDNTAGTGRPLTGAWLETDGLNFKSGTGAGGTPNASNYPNYYRNNVDTISASWGTYIPNQLSNGLLRIERRKLSDGTIGWVNTDADGIWDIGSVNTKNPSDGLNALKIATDDAPLINVAPKIYFTNAVQNITENAGTATISVSLKFPSANATSVNVYVAGGTASGTTDFTYSTQTITFPANSITPQTVTVSISNDASAESLETMILGLSSFTNGSSAGVPDFDTLTIIDDDAPFVSFASSSSSGLENITSVNIPVNIQFANSNATSVNIDITGGNATLGSDYTFSNQTITFPANSTTTINVPLTIINDAVTEGKETIIFTLSGATNGAILGTTVFTYSINDDDITPVLTFVRPTLQIVKENIGMVTVSVQLSNPALTATSITVSAFGGNASNGTDYSLPSNILTFPANTASVIKYSFPITDDVLIEGLENIILRLTNPSNNVTYTYEFDTVEITDNDLPLYTISQINKNDGLGVADSLGIRCELRGTVYGPNVRPGGYQFLLNDRTGGIQVFRAFGNIGGYIPQAMDSIVIKGEIQQNNGQLQIINLDTIYKIGTGIYKTPTIISSYSEANEGNYVTLQYCHLLNTTQWPTGAGTATVTVVDQNNKLYSTQVYRQTDIDSTPVTPYWFHISGFLVQNDLSIPWDSNYFLVPLRIKDYEYIYPKISFVTASDTASENIGLDSIELNLQWAPRTVTGTTVAFTGGTATFGQDFNFTSVSINFPIGFAVNAKQKIGVLIIDDATPEADESLNLAILGPTNNATAVAPSVHTLVIRFNDGAGNGIKNISNNNSVKVYPNPAGGILNIKTSSDLISARLMDLNGREIMETNSATMNVEFVSQGIYLLQVETREGIFSMKIAIE